MSRIGKNPVAVPNGVTVGINGQDISVSGPKGMLALTMVDEIAISMEGESIKVLPRNDNRQGRTMWGMQRTLVSNMVTGVTSGFTTRLEISGVGYRAAVQGKVLQLQMGYSHDVAYPIPDDVQIVCERPTAISVTGIDKQRVGQVAAEIRRYRPPEPYKGKGIRYENEFIFRKEGKKK
ncbi:MAG: 50S ribosomal protein L6 [Alphaproteobacteria bacterium]